MKLVTLIKMCLNKAQSKVHIGKMGLNGTYGKVHIGKHL
jgi:hypothetical protein